ncbi:hypothetical protein CEXT_20741 [Caerostris extrusa]|uniref:Uncharacterized protein n=1 Tax=Caerostris extrusa TaxID=172846 RepID=A0AAV4QS45_CAEEX|nr:hypothetical protein CEXT_20741 [Caerostris extrusa]
MDDPELEAPDRVFSYRALLQVDLYPMVRCHHLRGPLGVSGNTPPGDRLGRTNDNSSVSATGTITSLMFECSIVFLFTLVSFKQKNPACLNRTLLVVCGRKISFGWLRHEIHEGEHVLAVVRREMWEREKAATFGCEQTMFWRQQATCTRVRGGRIRGERAERPSAANEG